VTCRMKKNAHEIFKKVYSEHRDIVTRDRNSCLGILMDYGGREYPETYLFADALEINIEKQVIDNQPFTYESLEVIARDFASKKSIDFIDAKFAVETWADAMGFHQFDPSKYDNLPPGGANRSGPHSKPFLPETAAGRKKVLIAVLLAIFFGPFGLLYLSWKVSLATLVGSSVAWGIFGQADWAFTVFWLIGPAILACVIARRQS
jgi:hypothetical protein